MKNDRPSWDEYFLMLSFHVAKRSEDNDTKHGSILVDNSTKHIISTGYNAMFRDADISKFDLTRPSKYSYMIHSEENMILNCNVNPLNLINGATAYVTGKPCNDCLQRMINFGIDRIVYAGRKGTQLESKETDKIFNKIVKMANIDILIIDINNKWIKPAFESLINN